MNHLNFSVLGSLGLQLFTGALETNGLFVDVKPEDRIVQDILLLELIVQAIEFLFYSYLVYLILTSKISKDITSQRYLDWSITTPFMLISFMLFFKQLKDPSRNIRFFESFQEEKHTILKIVLANALMLLLGYMGEQSILNRPFAVSLGFLPFAYVFKILQSDYAKGNALSLKLFQISFFIWGLQGVAAVLPFVPKNIIQNILDLFSKNAQGLFLYFYILQIQVKNHEDTVILNI